MRSARGELWVLAAAQTALGRRRWGLLSSMIASAVGFGLLLGPPGEGIAVFACAIVAALAQQTLP
jgi:hypothetical protein